MSEWKQWECPNCGGHEYEPLSPTERQCKHCGAIFERDVDSGPVLHPVFAPLTTPLRFNGPDWRVYPLYGTADPCPWYRYPTYTTSATTGEL